MIRFLLIISLLLGCGTLCTGQQVLKNDASGSLYARQRAADVMRQLPSQIKAMDEPVLRVFLRLQAMKYFWARSSGKEAEALAAEAAVELKAHEAEIPPLYLNIFRRDLLTALKSNAPALVERFAEQYDLAPKDKPDQFSAATALLKTKEGVGPAVEQVRSALGGGRDPGPTIVFFLYQLEKEHPNELKGLLQDLLSGEEKSPGSLSLETLRWLKSFYLKDEMAAELKTRYLLVVINATRAGQGSLEPVQALFAYDLLGEVLPSVQSLLPAEYPRAASQMTALKSFVPKTKLDRTAIDNRVRESADPLNQLITEAGASENAEFKEELLIEAAQLAFKEEKLKLAADLVIDLPSEGQQGLWRDQFLGDVVNGSLEKKETSLAEYAASKIASPLKRASSMEKIALALAHSGDRARASEMLNDAFKLIESSDNTVAKIVAVLEAAAAFDKLDDSRSYELMRRAIKLINNLPRPGPEVTGAARKDYADSLMTIVWNLSPVFRSLAHRDALTAFSLADEIQRAEIKSSALFGAASEILARKEVKAPSKSN